MLRKLSGDIKVVDNNYTTQIYRVLASQLLDPVVSRNEVYQTSLELVYTLMVAMAKYEDRLPQAVIDRMHKKVQERVESKFVEAEAGLQSFFEFMGT